MCIKKQTYKTIKTIYIIPIKYKYPINKIGNFSNAWLFTFQKDSTAWGLFLYSAQTSFCKICKNLFYF
jgi:hypothetical protein